MKSPANLPTLSVVVPNYNHAHYLPECLASLLEQSVLPMEIIVIDDGSTDNSVAFLTEFCKKNPLVTFRQNPKNMGVLASLNQAGSIARGDYMVFPGADDRVLPGYFEKALNILAEHPEAGLFFSDPGSFDHVTGQISENRLHLSKGPAFFSPEKLVELGRHKRLLIAGNCIFKRSAFQQTGGYPLKLRWHSDYFLAFEIAFRHGACYLPEPLSLWRAMPASYMTKGIKQFKVQRTVVIDMLELLNSESYHDVLPYFVRSGACVWTPFVVPIILRHKKYWPMLSWPLLKWFWMVDLFWAAPHWLQRIIRNLKSKLT